MGRFIVHHDGLFLEWSTVVDAPVTYGMTADEMKQHITDQYGREGAEMADARLERARENGTSCIAPRYTFDDLVEYNRAGPGERQLSRDELIAEYFRPTVQ